MTDIEQLVTLRAWPGWPWKTLDPLAVEASTMGRLRAVEEAHRLRGERMVPASDFSYLDNRSNSFYRRLWIELHRMLRRGVPVSEWAGWD